MDSASVYRDNVPHRREAHAGAFYVCPRAGASAHELAEYGFALGERNAGALVAHANGYAVALHAVFEPDDRRIRRVLQGVIDQIAQGDAEGFRIRVDGAGAAGVSDFDSPSARTSLRPEFRSDTFDQTGGISLLKTEFARAGFHAAEVQQTFDQPLQAHRLPHQSFVIDLP